MYDFSGEWLLRVGLPAKSGVSGGVHGRRAVAVRRRRRSARGWTCTATACGRARSWRSLSERFGMHCSSRTRASPRRASPSSETAEGPLVRLGGELGFAGAERVFVVLREIAAASPHGALITRRRAASWRACTPRRSMVLRSRGRGPAAGLPPARVSEARRRRGSDPAQQRDRHRVGVVPVRPQLRAARSVVLRRQAGIGSLRRCASTSRASSSSIAAADSRRTSATTPAVSARCGEQVTYATMPPGLRAPIAARQQLALQLRQLGHVGRRLAPPRLGTPAQCTEPRARRIDEDAVVASGRPARTRPSCSDTGTSSGTPASAWRTSPARAGEISFASSRAPCSQRLGGEHRGLAARVRRTGRASAPPAAPASRGSARGPRAASPRPARAACPPDPRTSRSGSPPPRRKPIGEYGVRRASSGISASPGSAAIVTRGDALSAVRRASSSSARPSAASARRKARTTHTGCEKSRPSRSSSERALSATRVIHSPGVSRETRRSTALAKPAAPRPAGGARELDGLVDRRVRGDAGGEQLVHAEPQRIEHGRIDLLDAAVGGDRDDGVVGAPGGAACRRSARWPARRRRCRGRRARWTSGSSRFAYASDSLTARIVS